MIVVGGIAGGVDHATEQLSNACFLLQQATNRHHTALHIGFAMSLIRWLAVLPFLGILGGVPLLNRVTP